MGRSAIASGVGSSSSGRNVMGRSALQDRLVEEAPRRGHAEQRADTHRASGLAEDRDILGISAERVDVVAHPLEGGDLVSDPDIRGRAIVPVAKGSPIEEAEHTQPVVDRDNHDVASIGHSSAVIERGRSRSEDECTAVNPDENGTTRVVTSRRPDVQVEAVLTLATPCGADDAANHATHGADLRGSGPVGCCFAGAGP